jgi:predicted RNase H-like nuclease (RuvC/YqgF family)
LSYKCAAKIQSLSPPKASRQSPHPQGLLCIKRTLLGKASVTEAVDSDEGLSPIEKQIKDLKEKIKEFKEQLRELKGDNSEEAVEQRKLIQQQIMILNGMIASLSKKLNDQTVATPPKG